jgi:ABC-type multidrug transport system ATPase subunit
MTEGEVFALLVANGSGKTTTVETLGGRSAVDRALAESLFPGGLLASSS